MVFKLRRFRSFFNRTKETNLPEVLGTGKSGLGGECDEQNSSHGLATNGNSYESKGISNKWKHTQREPDIEKGEIYCCKCKGTGVLEGKNEWLEMCDKCFGDGIVDWITNAMKRRPGSMGSCGTSGFSVSSSSQKLMQYSATCMPYIQNNSALGYQAGTILQPGPLMRKRSAATGPR